VKFESSLKGSNLLSTDYQVASLQLQKTSKLREKFLYCISLNKDPLETILYCEQYLSYISSIVK
jgi:hypothetical protein